MGRHSASMAAEEVQLPQVRAGGGRRRARPAGRRRAWWRAAGVVAVMLGTTGVVGASSLLGEGANVVLNSSLDDSLAGWGVNPGAHLERVAGRHGGGGRISQTQRDHWTIALNDSRNSVSSAAAGSTYRAEAWVRGRAGQRVSLRLMEYRGSTLKGQQSDGATLPDGDWHRLTVAYRARESGSSLDLNVVAHDLPRGQGVDVDDVRLTAPSTSPSTATSPDGSAGPSSPTSPTGASNGTSNGASNGAASSQASDSAADTASGAGSRRSEAAVTAPPNPTAPARPSASPSRAPSSAAPAGQAAGRSGWRLVWADEFSGSGVDPSRWKVEDHSTYGDGNNELACLMNRPENLSVSSGVLHLIAREESTPITCNSSDSRFPNGRRYTSAHLTTKGKAEWTYGRFEVRAKLPTAAGTTKGLWPAFWLRPTAGGTGELDVLEAIGTDGSGSEHTKVHQTIWYDYSGTHRQQPATVTVPNGLPSAGFHTYAAEWEPGEIRWYIDDVLTYTRNRSTTPWIDEAFAKPFYLRLNLAIGGGWPGAPTGATEFPASYDVDHVRVYQR